MLWHAKIWNLSSLCVVFIIHNNNIYILNIHILSILVRHNDCPRDATRAWLWLDLIDEIIELSCPNAMFEIFGQLPPPRGKLAVIVRRYITQLFSFFFLCAVFSSFHTIGCEAYSFTTDGYGIFKVRTHLFRCVPYTRRGVRDKQGCTRVDSQRQKSCLSPCPTSGSNTGPSDLNSDALTTELHPPSFLWMFGPL